MLTVVVGTAVTALLGAILTVPATVQDPECKLRDPKTGKCIVVVEPNPDPGPGPDDDDSDSGDGTCQTTGGKQVPCQDPVHGWWLSGQDCYAKPAEPPPPPESPSWEGKYPRGDVYLLYCPGPVFPNTCGGQDPEQEGGFCFVWYPQPPYSTVSAEELAEQVVDSMGLRGPLIGIVPEPNGGSRGLVGMPVWMWTSVNERTWGPNTASASSGPLTVTATARAAHIDWAMGDGNTERCTEPGTPYRDSYGKAPSPDCGYRYEAAAAYTVTGTTHWVVPWEASTGETGEITLDLTDSVEVEVAEAQAVAE